MKLPWASIFLGEKKAKQLRDVDRIIESITKICPSVGVRQLKVPHRADDDGLWFFEHAQGEFEVQIESPTGMCPFLIETDEGDARFTAYSVDETVKTLAKLLHLELPGA